eukprot:GHVS01008836.1.p1 GENE.GHVS01008836.1~~GHVS01008836.1.p1  ORF type:complete len:133 (+),score=10.69 GHVS01008836.1:236-634(+)
MNTRCFGEAEGVEIKPHSMSYTVHSPEEQQQQQTSGHFVAERIDWCIRQRVTICTHRISQLYASQIQHINTRIIPPHQLSTQLSGTQVPDGQAHANTNSNVKTKKTSSLIVCYPHTPNSYYAIVVYARHSRL